LRHYTKKQRFNQETPLKIFAADLIWVTLRIRFGVRFIYNRILHKVSSRLVNENDAIAIENLDLKAMSKHKHGGRFSFGKSISDNGWGMFTKMLEYKLEWQGKSLVRIDKWYPSSQRCSQCGYRHQKQKFISS